MSIRCKAEDKDWGMQLSEILSLADARQLRQFLIENGLQPIITSKARSLPPVWPRPPGCRCRSLSPDRPPHALALGPLSGALLADFSSPKWPAF
jgi:hypothetical protein